MMNTTSTVKCAVTAVLFAVLFAAGDARAQNAAKMCSTPYLIVHTFAPAGTQWNFCWDVRDPEGLIIQFAYFRSNATQGSVERQILERASVAQAFVVYDQGWPRFHDFDFGFGTNIRMLSAADCPGTLLPFLGKNVVCLEKGDRGIAWADSTGGQIRRGKYVRLWSLHNAGTYVYLVQWTFHDDGSLHPEVGLTGELYPKYPAVPHVHNTYWRFDFDLDGAGGDWAYQITHKNFPPGFGTDTAIPFIKEAADTLYPLVSAFHITRHWRVRDKDNKIGYDLLPNPQGMFRGLPVVERFAGHDFWVSRYNKCEMYATKNHIYMNVPGGCHSSTTQFRRNVAQFVGTVVNPAQFVNGKDIVLWYAAHKHHHPHNEDHKQILLHPHGPTLRPHNAFPFNPTQP